jgi:hypothetical protein
MEDCLAAFIATAMSATSGSLMSEIIHVEIVHEIVAAAPSEYQAAALSNPRLSDAITSSSVWTSPNME